MRDKFSRLHPLRLESLESRQMLSVAPNDFVAAPLTPSADDAAAALVAAPQEATPLVEARSLLADGDAIAVIRGVQVVQSISADTTDLERGDALRDVLAQALPGDEVVLGAYVFDMGGTEHVEFPAQVTVTGAGKELTRISSGVPQWIDGAATFTLNDQTTVQDCWLEGTLYDGKYQTLVGMAGIPDNDITTYLRRVKITGDSDGIFIWTNQFHTYRLYAYDCDISTRYDAVAVLGSSFNPQYVELWNCTLTVQQPDAIPAHISNAVNISTGHVKLVNCTLNATGDGESVQTAGIFAWNIGSVEVINSTFNVTDPTGTAFDFWMVNDAQVIVRGGTGSGAEGAYTSLTGGEIYANATNSAVVDRAIFYNNSTFDGGDAAANVADRAAIAPDKTALLPGQTATFANFTSYTRGINGIIVDLAGPHGAISAAHFVFQVSNSPHPDAWSEAPAPKSVTILGGEGDGNSDRVEIIWEDGAIQRTWLQITMLPTAATGLAAPDVFLFGNLPGETGSGTSSLYAIANATDSAEAWEALQPNVPITSRYDFNRDGQVNSLDVLAPYRSRGYLWLIDAAAVEEANEMNAAVAAVLADETLGQAEAAEVVASGPLPTIESLVAIPPAARAAVPRATETQAASRPRWAPLQVRAAQDAVLLDDAWREGL